ncbi:MAG: peptidylprolyl isomerase [Campylobacterales bacterium]
MRIFLISSLLFLGLYAKATLVDGISFFVNEKPVTLYQLYKTEQSLGVSQSDAMEQLIRRELEDAEIERYNISITPQMVENEIEKIASGYGLDYFEFKESVQNRGINWKSYREDLKRKLELDELNAKIVREELKMPSQEDARQYYDLNKDEFMIPRSVDVIQYSSSSEETLKKQTETPFSVIDGVSSKAQTLDTTKYGTDFANLLTRTKEGSFTQIIETNGSFSTFYVKNKADFVEIPFEDVQRQVVDMMLRSSENRILNSHLEKLRAQADIRVVRLP